MNRRVVLHAAVWFACLSVTAAAPRPLLPRPQEVHYAEGGLPVSGLSIRFAMPANAEDRFAGEALASGLSRIAGTKIEMRETAGSAPAILLERTGTGTAVPGEHDTPGPSSREAYSLNVATNEVRLQAASSAGLFYAVQTLLQLAEGEGQEARLPAVQIRDWPALAYRGFMMDFSHGQQLRISEIERQIELLSRFKANQYYFYSEASIELKGYELVTPDGRYTREEVKYIIDFARQRHMDVVPCLELYGHMHDLFRVEKFADLGLPQYGDEFDPRNPKVLAVLDDMFAQIAGLFPSAWCHVGFDEPWSLGKIGMTPGQDPFKTFIEVLGHLAGQAQKHGKRLMYWADIMNGASTLSNHPELLDNLPSGTIAVPWVYDALANYDPYVEPLTQAGLPTVVAPAVWNWNEIYPDFHRSFVDINGLTAAGRKNKTLGILNTGWTDSAQTLYRLSLPGLAFGAAAGWQSEPVDTNSFFADYTAQAYPSAVAAELAPAMEELSTVEQMFARILQNATQHGFWRDPLEPKHLARLESQKIELHKARRLAETALERLLRAQKIAPEDPTLPSLLLAAKLFDYLGMKSLYAVEWAGYFRQLKANPDPKLVTLYIGIQMNAQDHGMLADLTDTITGLREPYRQAWLAESTPYRLGTALARWDRESQFWLDTWHRVNELLRSRGKNDPFPNLDYLRKRE